MSITVNNLNMYFGKKQVLFDINFEIKNGIYGLMGPNGAGKTTLMRNLVGLMKAREGSVKIDGKIGYLSQHYGAFKDFTCIEILDYYATYRKEKVDKIYLIDMLRKVHLESEADKKVKHLSGGMLRRLGIAQALLSNPDVIILDEPLVGLDPEERSRIKAVLKESGKEKIVIISTHIVEDIENACDKYLIMKKGRIVFSGDKERLLAMASNKSGKSVNTIEEGYLCIVQN